MKLPSQCTINSIVSALIIAALIFLVFNPVSNKESNYKKEVEALAFSHSIYSKSSICPNKTGLDELRVKYLENIPKDQVAKRDWINKNFNTLFTETCLNHESGAKSEG